MSVKSVGGALYYVSFIDECSRYTVIVPIARKGDTAENFNLFHPWFERKFSCVI